MCGFILKRRYMCSKSISTCTPQCSTAGHRVKSVNMQPQLKKLRFMCMYFCMFMCTYAYLCLEHPGRKMWQLQVQYIRDGGLLPETDA